MFHANVLLIPAGLKESICCWVMLTKEKVMLMWMMAALPLLKQLYACGWGSCADSLPSSSGDFICSGLFVTPVLKVCHPAFKWLENTTFLWCFYEGFLEGQNCPKPAGTQAGYLRMVSLMHQVASWHSTHWLQVHTLLSIPERIKLHIQQKTLLIKQLWNDRNQWFPHMMSEGRGKALPC